MTNHTSYLIGWTTLHTHQRENTGFPNAVFGGVAFGANAFRCFRQKFANILSTQGRSFISGSGLGLIARNVSHHTPPFNVRRVLLLPCSKSEIKIIQPLTVHCRALGYCRIDQLRPRKAHEQLVAYFSFCFLRPPYISDNTPLAWKNSSSLNTFIAEFFLYDNVECMLLKIIRQRVRFISRAIFLCCFHKKLYGRDSFDIS